MPPQTGQSLGGRIFAPGLTGCIVMLPRAKTRFANTRLDLWLLLSNRTDHSVRREDHGPVLVGAQRTLRTAYKTAPLLVAPTCGRYLLGRAG